MHDDFIQWIAAFGIVGMGILFLTEVGRWRSLSTVITPRQRVLRVFLIVSVEALLVMLFVAPWVTDRSEPVRSLVYWTAFTTLLLAVVVMAAVDLWAVTKGYAALNRRMFGDWREDDRRED